MRFLLVAVGDRMPGWVDAAVADYSRRMPRGQRIELVEVRPEPRQKSSTIERILAAEAERLASAIPSRAVRVVLDERGRELTTAQFVTTASQWIASGSDVAFVIGGADGISPDFKGRADLLLRLSGFTLPHGLVRVMMAEALYRAVSVLNHHPYHRA